MVNADGTNPHKIANQGLINVHPNWGVLADVDDDGVPDYQQGNSILGSVDLSMAMAASPEPVITGSTLTYTATVRNFGPDEALDATAFIFIPTGTAFSSATASQGACSKMVINGVGAARCELGGIAPNPNVPETLTLKVNVDCALETGDLIETTGGVIAATLDSNTANNSAETTSTALDTPPAITNVAVDRAELRPPDHKMIDVTVNYNVADNCDPNPVNTLSVTSDEPINGTGDGDAAPDWEVVDAHHVRLRAKRTGAGDGRVYTITITSTDSHGNSSNKTVTVQVPRSN